MSTQGNSLGSDVMMQLGPVQFGVSTAAYQELARSAGRKWAAVPRFGMLDALQDCGPDEDTITLSGVIYPEYFGGFEQVASMRDAMDQAVPHMLVSGLGDVMGLWVITKVDERQGIFAAAGQPRRQEFTVQLRKYSDGAV